MGMKQPRNSAPSESPISTHSLRATGPEGEWQIDLWYDMAVLERHMLPMARDRADGRATAVGGAVIATRDGVTIHPKALIHHVKESERANAGRDQSRC